MTSYADALRFLHRFDNYEFTPLSRASAATLDLRRMRGLLARLGDPHTGRRTVHITGSKGKGSTAAMIAAMLRGAGHSVGLYTSPHLHRETERTQIDGRPLSEEEFVRLMDELIPAVGLANASGEFGQLTAFELRTALAFLAFRRHALDWQVVEVGLGGRLDATNVLDEKDACVFTPVSLEHTQILGNTVAEIARDKAGILRRGTRAVMGLQRESAAEVLRAACAALDVPLTEAAQACQMAPGRVSEDGQEMRLRTPRSEYRITLPLLGRHQLENAATAVLSVEQLAGVVAPPEVVRTALAEVRWPGRLEVLKRRPLLVVDGAHNADSARRLAQALRAHFSFRRLFLVVGLNQDKDIAAFARELAPLQPEVVATRAQLARAAAPTDVAAAFAALDLAVRQSPDVAAAVESTLEEAGPADLICVTGSLYVVAEARAWVLGVVPDPVTGLH